MHQIEKIEESILQLLGYELGEDFPALREKIENR